MKQSILLFILLCYTSCHAQKENLILQQQLVADVDSIETFDITYLSDGLQVKGYLVKPAKEGHYPCIIYNRGGNRDFGALNVHSVAVILEEIAKEGYIIIASQYRGNGGGEGKEEFGGTEINDILVLPKILAEIEGADTTRIGMYGWSRGGMMTYIALTKTNQIKTAVVGGAVSDCFTSVEERPMLEQNVHAELIPNYWENKEEELRKRSAIHFADQFSQDVPILMLHGNSDWRVKSFHSLRLALAFEEYRIPYRLVIFEGADHGIGEHKEEVHEQIVNWFDKYLKNDAPLPNMEYHGR